MKRRKLRILVVDDDADFLDITRHAIEAGGHEATCCGDVEVAWATLQQQAFDAVVCDLMMTNLDAGFMLAARIKGDSRLAALPVILATSARSTSGFDFSPKGEDDLKQMNVDAYLDKPVTADTLLATLDRLADGGECNGH